MRYTLKVAEAPYKTVLQSGEIHPCALHLCFTGRRALDCPAGRTFGPRREESGGKEGSEQVNGDPHVPQERLAHNLDIDKARLVKLEINFYALRRDGRCAGASLWSHASAAAKARPRQFAMNIGPAS